MLKPVALFINGVFESVLEEILAVQTALPEHIMFLQPHTSRVIKALQADTPVTDAPMRLFLSTTDSLATVHYQAEIVGWRDKRELSKAHKPVINRLIAALQPNEKELYNAAKGGSGESVNLLYVRRLQKLSDPFSVAQLRKISDGSSLSTGRTTAGGWAYVEPSILSLALG